MKTIKRYHFIPTRMAKKIKDKQYERFQGYEGYNPHTWLMGW